MKSRVGIRDLRFRASEIVREVYEQGAEYVVTRRGEPMAVLKPLSAKTASEIRRAEREEALARLDELAERIARSWRSPKRAASLGEEQRR